MVKFRLHTIQFRVSAQEMSGFQTAAKLAGKTLSAWARDQLRMTAEAELKKRGFTAKFVEERLVGPVAVVEPEPEVKRFPDGTVYRPATQEEIDAEEAAGGGLTGLYAAEAERIRLKKIAEGQKANAI